MITKRQGGLLEGKPVLTTLTDIYNVLESITRVNNKSIQTIPSNSPSKGSATEGTLLLLGRWTRKLYLL